MFNEDAMGSEYRREFFYPPTGTSPFAPVREEYGGWEVIHGDGHHIVKSPDGAVRVVGEEDVGTWLDRGARISGSGADEELHIELVELSKEK